jgi:predicted transcriptional regulator
MNLQKKKPIVFAFRITKDVDRELTEMAETQEVTKAEIIRFALTRLFKTY